jgi:glycosyltransferase involved in cell wall biosynthesis
MVTITASALLHSDIGFSKNQSGVKTIDIIIPVYNEQGNIHELAMAIHQVMRRVSYSYKILFVDDGSSDNTLDMIKALSDTNPLIKYISFSRNFGHQSALKAGLDISEADAVIFMDGDLQHPPDIIPRLLQKWEEGYEVVYTIRKENSTIPFFKKNASAIYYALINRISDTRIHPNAADFRLLDKSVVEVLKKMDEYNLFIRGMISWVGYRQTGIEFKAGERKHGQSKYDVKRMFSLGMDGITSFSVKPLYMASYLGCGFSLVSVLYLPYAIGSYVFGYSISGWTSIIITISFFGGLQLMILGIIGIYLGKLFMQSKDRPLYITKESNIPCREKVANMSY